jgi:hypothetical protein
VNIQTFKITYFNTNQQHSENEKLVTTFGKFIQEKEEGSKTRQSTNRADV